MFGSKPSKPVDRALRDVERELTAVRRKLRTAERPAPPVAAQPRQPSGNFIKEMLLPSQEVAQPTYHAKRRDLFDVNAEPLKELEADIIPSSQRPAADLFSPAVASPRTGTVSLNSPAQDKLLTYFSAGGLKSFRQTRPLKSVQRRDRKRFFTWLGLAFGVLWLLYVLVS